LQIRTATADYLVELAKACQELGGTILVLGSPAQRRIPAGFSKEQATEFAVDTLKRTIDGISKAGVMLCLEPLSPPDADFINTASEGLEIVEKINHPNYCLHLDVKAMSTEPEPTTEVIRKYIGKTGHFHANDSNLRGPGFGNVDFVPIFQTLLEKKYSGWVSVEVFDYKPDPKTIATQSIAYMKDCEVKARNLLTNTPR
jgi:sugar phosphate isomerase/epimerase